MIKLAVLFLFPILVAGTTSPAQIDEYEAVTQIPIQQCISELNANEDDAKILQDLNRMPENEAQSCILECSMNKMGVVKDGKVDHEIFMKMGKLVYGEDFFHKNEDKMEQYFTNCQQEVMKKSEEKCGSGVAMRSCTILDHKI